MDPSETTFPIGAKFGVPNPLGTSDISPRRTDHLATLRLSSLTRQLRDTLAQKRKRRVRTNLFLIAGFVVAIVAIGAFATQYFNKQPESSGNTFYGRLVDSSFSGTTQGTVREDRDCSSPDGMMYTCTAVIDHQGGTIYFHYTHNMHAQPCLSLGDKVQVFAKSNGDTTVTRLA